MATHYIPPVSRTTFETVYKTPLTRNQNGLYALFANTIETMGKISVGPYIWTISNLADLRISLSGGMVEELTGLSADEFTALPDGAATFAAAEDNDAMFGFLYHSMEYRKQFSLERRNTLFFSYFFRFRRDNTDRWMMFKTIEESPEKAGRPQYLLAMLTDVSHIKQSGVPMMTIFDSSTQQRKVFESAPTVIKLDIESPSISKREHEILRQVARGNSSKMIADLLKISTKTVENHRRNLLLKTSCRTSSELISFAIKNGLL